MSKPGNLAALPEKHVLVIFSPALRSLLEVGPEADLEVGLERDLDQGAVDRDLGLENNNNKRLNS